MIFTVLYFERTERFFDENNFLYLNIQRIIKRKNLSVDENKTNKNILKGMKINLTFYKH